MPTFITLAAAEAGEVPLPMPPWAYGLLAFVIFMALLLFVWMFRRTAQSMVTAQHGTHARPTHTTGAAASNPDSGRGH